MTHIDDNVGMGVPSTDTTSSGGLRGNMGVTELMFTVLAYNAPVVTFLSFIPVAILLGNGLGVPVAFIACGLLIASLSYGIVAMASHLDKPGGFYAIVTAGLGRIVGLSAGFAALLGYFMATFATYGVVGLALDTVVVDLLDGPHVSWWVWSLLAAAAVSVLGYVNINLSAKVMVCLLGCELILVVAYDLAVLFQGGASGIGFDSFTGDSIFSGSLAIALLFGVALYGGFEATVIFRDEVKDSRRTIPRATFGVVAAITILYAFTAWLFINSFGANAVMSVLGKDYISSGEQSVHDYLGSFAGHAVVVLLFTSAFALVLAAHNITARYLFNLAADEILPRKLAQAHAVHVSPHRASITVSVLSVGGLVLLAATKSDAYIYAKFLGLYGYTFVMLLAVVSLAAFVYLWRRQLKRPAVFALLPLPVLLTTLVLATDKFVLLSGAEGTWKVVLLSSVWGFTLLGAVVAVVLRRRRPDIYARIGRQ
ncbi:APC family permease [Streptomyces plumbiresistens]|uniref:APC family permease n=1 Tax=Streptomyces plumbiresistens TaxID=511811 RepID=A0ABP7SKD0_9ACTN